MTKTTGARVLLGTANVLLAAQPMLISSQASAAPTEQKIEKLNVATLHSIESTWLQVPRACKARGFNASPTELRLKQANPQIQNIYSSFGV